MKFQIGDKVILLNEKGEGIVNKIIDNNTVLVTVKDGFNFPFSVKDLINITDKYIQEETIYKTFHRDFRHKEDINKIKNESIESNVREIDLHIEELIDDYAEMSEGKILRFQISYFKECLEEAIMNNEKRIIFIHGVGEGILKYEIRNILKKYDNIDFQDANYKDYGFGATEVFIKI